MIRLATRHLAAIHAATSAEDLHESVQNAIRLEFATIPPYLTAMLSLHVDKNREIWTILDSVVVDEMLHMMINCNLLIALGGTPVIDSPTFLPPYPGPLPMAIRSGLTVGCQPFSMQLVSDMFMAIEQPEKVQSFPVAPHLLGAPPSFATIGMYYHALKAKIEELGNAVFKDNGGRQLVEPRWFSADRLFPIVDVASALKALDLIVAEGEGTSTSPEGDPGVIAHYYRFEQIIKGRKLIRDTRIAEGYSFSGDEIPFDPGGVWPITKNQKLRDLNPDSQAARCAAQFAYTFTKLLKALQEMFSGQPNAFTAALSIMFELKLAGQRLCSTPIDLRNPNGPHAGPAYEYVAQNRYPNELLQIR